ncbi:GNAT family N-acetyltransferase [Mycobacterium shimoidei]|nr:GNAT family N-acetyltransferase [Mycobacterium shimoidei]MCV7258847.1 N-acetyltransferase [Mycobacterium shimoidei]ODR15261.1 GNAT family N-acetyltransferase [Mycobacterium shimoidei]ORW79844.1 acetyltransferase [Mycobacterium shimoidei]
MATDKTGAQTTVSAEAGKYTIGVDGKTVGHANVADRDNQRIFYHTEIDPDFGGRGLATILIQEALEATRADGKRVVPVCEMVAGVIKKSPKFQDIADPVTPDIQRWVQTLPLD